MAMPTSGTLYLCNDAQEINCRSIAHVVYGGSLPSTVCLSTVGDCAGMTGNITMQCFYGYSPSIFLGYCLDSGSGVNTIGGTVRLMCCNGIEEESCFYGSCQETLEGGWDVPAGCYYYDFALVTASDGRGGVSNIVCWTWQNDASSGASLSTSCVNSTDTVNGLVNCTER